MLSKAICFKCLWKRVFVIREMDEDNWREGYVYCPNAKRIKINDPPPRSCYYKFEHAVAEGSKDA